MAMTMTHLTSSLGWKLSPHDLGPRYSHRLAPLTLRPIPGTSVFTPWLLARLGLMPSRWREAHLLDQLRKEAARLRQAGHSEQAKRVSRLGSDLEAEANARERAAHEASLLTHWDANQNGIWEFLPSMLHFSRSL